ncbi:MAG: lipid-A-disaccharide synthase [Firmicutes bacterium]|nr:lipid-A-disaccharide synthase [Bacillota bacterium]MCM1401341.1 lipid-A-disaccharide synthase [Bacteroides sp.]MCM1477294.1 lipid-A-disaccharide synthase [Bacteroides sp.]
MHYFISAGEPSGDLHASALISQLAEVDPQARFTFLGGDLMAEAAGHPPVIHYRKMAFMGFSEVLRNLRNIARNFSTARKAIDAARPDALILVDYPSFNLKLAKYASERNIPVFYFIAPKVWAWKAWRVKQLRRYVRRVLSILPFEVDYFSGKSVEVTYVGNPSVQEVDEKLAAAGSLSDFLKLHSLPADKPLLALVPGSRRGEIKNNLPIMDAVARRHPGLQAVIAAAPGIDADFYDRFSQLPRVDADTFRLMHFAQAALVTSGTATLECALAGTPEVVCYRANGSRLSYNIMKRLIKVPFVSLPNLIAGHEIIPEMLVHLCTVDSVDRQLQNILPGQPGREAQLEGFKLMRSKLNESTAARKAAQTIINHLK